MGWEGSGLVLLLTLHSVERVCSGMVLFLLLSYHSEQVAPNFKGLPLNKVFFDQIATYLPLKISNFFSSIKITS